MKGLFITFYGMNNIGKSTHVRMLAEDLKKDGYDVETLKYPRYELEPTGPFLNTVLRDHDGDGQTISEEELQMWFTLNRYQFQPQLEQWLQEGKIVIAEDYVATGIAWGMAKGADEQWLTALNQYLLQPDFSILLHGQRFLKSKEEDHIHEMNDRLVEKTGEIFLKMAEKNAWHVMPVDGDKPHVAGKIYKLVKNFLTSWASDFS